MDSGATDRKPRGHSFPIGHRVRREGEGGCWFENDRFVDSFLSKPTPPLSARIRLPSRPLSGSGPFFPWRLSPSKSWRSSGTACLPLGGAAAALPYPSSKVTCGALEKRARCQRAENGLSPHPRQCAAGAVRPGPIAITGQAVVLVRVQALIRLPCHHVTRASCRHPGSVAEPAGEARSSPPHGSTASAHLPF